MVQSKRQDLDRRLCAATLILPFPVVEVRVTAESEHSATTYALLNNGSTNTFCSTGLIHNLRSRGQRASLGLTTPEGEDSKFKTLVLELELL